MDGGEVIWRDGSREAIDTIVFATGYRPDLAYLVGTGALGAHGEPLHRSGISTTVAGLGYVGLDYQRSLASATLRGVASDARYVLARMPAPAGSSRRSRSACCSPVLVGR